MSLGRRLWRSELTGIAALILCAVGVAIVVFGDGVRSERSLQSLSSAARISLMGLGYTVAIGALPVIVYGAPIYALLAHAGRTNGTTVSLLGMLPGGLALPLDVWLGGCGIGCGVIVASITHLLMQRWMRRSNSALLTDTSTAPLRAQHGAAKRER